VFAAREQPLEQNTYTKEWLDVAGNERQNWEVRGMFLSMQLTSRSVVCQGTKYSPPPLRTFPSNTEPPLNNSQVGDKCLLLIGRHAEDRLHE